MKKRVSKTKLSVGRIIRTRMIKKGYKTTDSGKFVHRDIYEKVHGKINKDWIVHHIDCSKTNNVIDNLIAVPIIIHTKIHHIISDEKRNVNRDEILSFLDDSITKIGTLLKKQTQLILELNSIEKELTRLHDLVSYKPTPKDQIKRSIVKPDLDEIMDKCLT